VSGERERTATPVKAAARRSSALESSGSPQIVFSIRVEAF